MWLGFFKERIVPLIFLGNSLLSPINNFLLIPAKSCDFSPDSVSQLHSFHNRKSYLTFSVQLNVFLKAI